MTKFYVTIDDQNLCNGCYRDDVHTTIPDGAIEVSSVKQEKYRQRLDTHSVKGWKARAISKIPTVEQQIIELIASVTPFDTLRALLGNPEALAKLQQIQDEIEALQVQL